jgi:hypothetical protein
MPHYVDPRRFLTKPLVLKAVADGEASVMIDGLRAGRILQQVHSDQRIIFVWSLTGPYRIAAGLTSAGEADTLEEAKAAVRKAFDAWLTWALAKDMPMAWHG